MAARHTRKPTVECKYPECRNDSRSLGYCDTHYRQSRRGNLHEIGQGGMGGVPPKDGAVYKIRVRAANGTQPHYYSDRRQAEAFAERAAENGTLLYFARYSREEIYKG